MRNREPVIEDFALFLGKHPRVIRKKITVEQLERE